MRYALLLILVVHGLIHFMGFAKAFDLAALEQLRSPIARPMGLLWLAAGVLLITSAVMLLAAPSGWWLPAGVGLTLSQLVIIAAWSDAKFGTIANLIVLVPVVIAGLGHAPWSYRAQYERDVAAGLGEAPQPATVVTEADIATLPPIVQKYLRFTGVVGQPQVQNYRVAFRGELRNGPSDAWMPVAVEQQSFVDPAERLFFIDGQMFGVPMTAYHRYIGPEATFEVKVAALVKVVDARGPEMNRAETVTLFNDMCLLAPATLIDPAIRWEEIDPLTVRATFTNAGNTIAAVLTFDERGALNNFSSDDRTRTTDGAAYTQARWSTPVVRWRTVDGYTLPDAEARWQLPGGEFTYARFEVVDVGYNVTGR